MSERKSTEGQEQRKSVARVVSPARLSAFNILRRVEEDGAFASLLLAASEDELSAQDRALCYELVQGTLRWQLWLDHLIAHYAGRKAESLDLPVRTALRLGLYQLRVLSRIPASAAVNESVNLVRLARLRSAAALVNAVLRRATREPQYNPAAQIKDPLQRISIETSHPLWLIERWTRAFGLEEAEGFARANNQSPPTAFRLVQTETGEPYALEALRAEGGLLEPSEITPDAWRIQGAGALLRKMAREGRIYLQDEASQLVAQVLDARAGERVLDTCAAPGSKTTQIATRTRDLKLIVAGDIYEHRLRTVIESSELQKADKVRTVALDAEVTLPFAQGSFERVLVDAPCTGTGTLRRNPEIRWRISQSDIADLSARQKRIIFNASGMVRPGGRLVYSTCSVEPEENEEVVAAFLRGDADFKLVHAPVAGRLLQPDGTARSWPHRDGTDGFFIAAFERRN
ncbi:MAG TPA: 16S rRNA (cytosine(967)-C(5))-methyltransferase RsmB [Pyrinomonadaceae bacterium]|jgi:16S rRNA (cytosine967-C5)-methyltransferase